MLALPFVRYRIDCDTPIRLPGYAVSDMLTE